MDEIVASNDARGHCIMITDSSGTIRDQYDYDAFGMPYFYNAAGTSPGNSSGVGDVASYKLSGGGTAYSGHTGIIISDKAGGTTNISAHADGVYTKTKRFENDSTTTYRRYTGD